MPVQVFAQQADRCNNNPLIVIKSHTPPVIENLQEAGALHIGDIAQRTRLGVDLLVPVLQQRLGSVIPGKLEGGLLYTDAHIARIRVRSRLKPALDSTCQQRYTISAPVPDVAQAFSAVCGLQISQIFQICSIVALDSDALRSPVPDVKSNLHIDSSPSHIRRNRPVCGGRCGER